MPLLGRRLVALTWQRTYSTKYKSPQELKSCYEFGNRPLGRGHSESITRHSLDYPAENEWLRIAGTACLKRSFAVLQKQNRYLTCDHSEQS